MTQTTSYERKDRDQLCRLNIVLIIELFTHINAMVVELSFRQMK
jgi:hypothetical protein